MNRFNPGDDVTTARLLRHLGIVDDEGNTHRIDVPAGTQGVINSIALPGPPPIYAVRLTVIDEKNDIVSGIALIAEADLQ